MAAEATLIRKPSQQLVYLSTPKGLHPAFVIGEKKSGKLKLKLVGSSGHKDVKSSSIVLKSFGEIFCEGEISVHGMFEFTLWSSHLAKSCFYKAYEEVSNDPLGIVCFKEMAATFAKYHSETDGDLRIRLVEIQRKHHPTSVMVEIEVTTTEGESKSPASPNANYKSAVADGKTSGASGITITNDEDQPNGETEKPTSVTASSKTSSKQKSSRTSGSPAEEESNDNEKEDEETNGSSAAEGKDQPNGDPETPTSPTTSSKTATTSKTPRTTLKSKTQSKAAPLLQVPSTSHEDETWQTDRRELPENSLEFSDEDNEDESEDAASEDMASASKEASVCSTSPRKESPSSELLRIPSVCIKQGYMLILALNRENTAMAEQLANWLTHTQEMDFGLTIPKLMSWFEELKGVHFYVSFVAYCAMLEFHHSGHVNAYYCSFCNHKASYTSRDSFIRHYHLRHDFSELRFKCRWCVTYFKSHDKLKVHENNHDPNHQWLANIKFVSDVMLSLKGFGKCLGKGSNNRTALTLLPSGRVTRIQSLENSQTKTVQTTRSRVYSTPVEPEVYYKPV